MWQSKHRGSLPCRRWHKSVRSNKGGTFCLCSGLAGCPVCLSQSQTLPSAPRMKNFRSRWDGLGPRLPMCLKLPWPTDGYIAVKSKHRYRLWSAVAESCAHPLWQSAHCLNMLGVKQCLYSAIFVAVYTITLHFWMSQFILPCRN